MSEGISTLQASWVRWMAWAITRRVFDAKEYGSHWTATDTEFVDDCATAIIRSLDRWTNGATQQPRVGEVLGPGDPRGPFFAGLEPVEEAEG